MMVEFIEQDTGNQLIVTASEFLKADKDQDEYASLAMATDAYSALFGIRYIIHRDEYDAVKSWLRKNDIVVFQVCEACYGRNKWCEVYVLQNARHRRVIYSDDEMGGEMIIVKNPNSEPTLRGTTARSTPSRK